MTEKRESRGNTIKRVGHLKRLKSQEFKGELRKNIKIKTRLLKIYG